MPRRRRKTGRGGGGGGSATTSKHASGGGGSSTPAASPSAEDSARRSTSGALGGAGGSVRRDTDTIKDVGPSDDEARTCCLCFEDAEWFAVGSCDHDDVCALCAYRLRVVMRDRSCPLCKATNDMIVITRVAASEKRFADYPTFGTFGGSSMAFDERGQLFVYTDADSDGAEAAAALLQSLRALTTPACTVKGCVSFRGGTMRALETHLRDVHSMQYCSICLDFRPLFVAEHQAFTESAMQRHREAEHQRCTFCAVVGDGASGLYFDESALLRHMRDRHHSCGLCGDSGPGSDWYAEYVGLQAHFEDDHFPCTEAECVAARHVVFATADELAAHRAFEHGAGGAVLPLNFRFRERSDRDPALNRTQRVGLSREETSSPPLVGSDSRSSGGADGTVPSASDFPTLGSSNPVAAAAVVAVAGRGGRRRRGGRRGGGAVMNPAAFPALGSSEPSAVGASAPSTRTGRAWVNGRSSAAKVTAVSRRVRQSNAVRIVKDLPAARARPAARTAAGPTRGAPVGLVDAAAARAAQKSASSAAAHKAGAARRAATKKRSAAKTTTVASKPVAPPAAPAVPGRGRGGQAPQRAAPAPSRATRWATVPSRSQTQVAPPPPDTSSRGDFPALPAPSQGAPPASVGHGPVRAGKARAGGVSAAGGGGHASRMAPRAAAANAAFIRPGQAPKPQRKKRSKAKRDIAALAFK